MIEVHSPKRLESEVLHKYFRHSKFASFQRQLNYFGFRKQAGKGKMAPCSYVNEDLPSTDLGCLLHIKVSKGMLGLADAVHNELTRVSRFVRGKQAYQHLPKKRRNKARRKIRSCHRVINLCRRHQASTLYWQEFFNDLRWRRQQPLCRPRP